MQRSRPLGLQRLWVQTAICPVPSLLQVNNATARVMTNKKAANPYINGKGWRMWGSRAGLGNVSSCGELPLGPGSTSIGSMVWGLGLLFFLLLGPEAVWVRWPL